MSIEAILSMCACMLTHARTHAQTHALTHSHTHTHPHTQTHTLSHTHTSNLNTKLNVHSLKNGAANIPGTDEDSSTEQINMAGLH